MKRKPKYQIGDVVSTKDGILFGKVSEVLKGEYGFKYLIEGYDVSLYEEQLVAMDKKIETNYEIRDVVKHRHMEVKDWFVITDVNRIKGTVTMVSVVNGEEYEHVPFTWIQPVESYEEAEEMKKHTNPDVTNKLDSELGFLVDDLVVVNGYHSVFTVLDIDEEDDEKYYVSQYGMEDIADEMVAYREDMRHASTDEIIQYEEFGIIKAEFSPTDKKMGDMYTHRNKEKKFIDRLNENRYIVEELKKWQDWFLDLYNYTGDEKYIRRIKRVQGWVNKVPVRAYQIKEES